MPGPNLPFTIVQDIFKSTHPLIRVDLYEEHLLTPAIIHRFLDTTNGGAIGVAPAYGKDSVLLALAFSSSENVLLVYFARKPWPQRERQTRVGRELLQNLILCADSEDKFAFKMDGLATALHFDVGLRITRGVDLLSAAREHRGSMAALMSVLGGEDKLQRLNLIRLFKQEENVHAPVPHIALQAWTAWRAATIDTPELAQQLAEVPRIDTLALSAARLHCLAKLTREARRLTILKPTRVENEVDSEFSCKGGKLQVTSTRFKTRVLATRNQRIEVESTVEGKTSTFSGKTVFVNGRAARILLNTAFQGDTIRVTTVGRERPTRAEEQRADVVLKTLQQTCTLLEHPFFQAIWLPHELDAAAGAAWKRVPRPKREVSLYFPDRTLNDSQARAVRAILSTKDRDRLVLVQGPPGTGKTTVIAAAVTSILESVDYDRTVWVVAQSNVAVKNIAEKLADAECNFTLVVSKDFHYDWHEHLYGEIMDNVVRSDDLSDDIFGVEQRLVGSRVVLCTLSMLSNPKLSLIIRFVPLETLIVDEASQVEIGDFLPMLYHFSKTLQKLVCIGDDKQLPPFGQNNIYSLQSIFEIEHLRKRAIFLDTQYRMPEQIGAFIGKHVYDGKLKTVHRITKPCCRFISVKGTEVAKGRSWINVAEAQAAIAEARVCYSKGRSYRILTPYDAQRGILEQTLKAAKIPWENKVFCVDSFQGNEDDYMIISIVRTERIGFLAEQRRVNVMLSRCKKGMVICTNRTFMQGAAKGSLVGLLASEIGPSAWD